MADRPLFRSNMHQDDSKRGAGFLLLNIVGQTGPLLVSQRFLSFLRVWR